MHNSRRIVRVLSVVLLCSPLIAMTPRSFVKAAPFGVDRLHSPGRHAREGTLG